MQVKENIFETLRNDQDNSFFYHYTMIGDLERANIRLKATAGVARYKIKHTFKEISNQVGKRWRTDS